MMTTGQETTTEQDAWSAMIADRDAGKCVQIDEGTFNYFLEVLPPVLMGETYRLVDGIRRRTAFGFAEGAERITAFWSETENGQRRFYMQHTTSFNEEGG